MPESAIAAQIQGAKREMEKTKPNLKNRRQFSLSSIEIELECRVGERKWKIFGDEIEVQKREKWRFRERNNGGL